MQPNATDRSGRQRQPSGAPGSQEISWAADTLASSIQHVGVDHHRAEVLVPERFLHCPDVVAVLEQMARTSLTDLLCG